MSNIQIPTLTQFEIVMILGLSYMIAMAWISRSNTLAYRIFADNWRQIRWRTPSQYSGQESKLMGESIAYFAKASYGALLGGVVMGAFYWIAKLAYLNLWTASA